jgi:hypothetical protein
MPVVAQGCKPRAAAAAGPSTGSTVSPGKGIEHVYDDDESARLDPTTLKGAIAAAQQTRALQTSNAAAFLAATSGSGKHKYAGKNVSIGGVKGYITDKGLFKQWTDGNLMTKAGRYGCPASASITQLPGYSIPTNESSTRGTYNGNYGAYVGAKIASSSNDDPLFMGSGFAASWDNSESSLPACGNEGSNVQVVYPAKATGAAYRGTYNTAPESNTMLVLQTDMDSTTTTYLRCKERAEQRGKSVFGLASNAKCYIGGGTLEQAKTAGIAFEFIGNIIHSQTQAPAKKLHFGADGTLNLYNSLSPSASAVVMKLGSTTPISECDFTNGGLMSEAPIGTYGSNCNSILEPYLTNTYIGTW